ncbi:MAG: penicillin-binding protein 2 [Epsilonproteobacteria bacterium]|nr:penicillin-binding protein 2 [Campylobacterota bacterium]
MSKQIVNKAIKKRTIRVTILFSAFSLLMVIFLISILKIILTDRKVPNQYTTIHDRAFRGKIISKDGYTLSYSQKIYTATIVGASIDPKKRDLFIKLFSIYSDIEISKVKSKMKDKNGNYKKGYIILSQSLNQKAAMQLKSLSYKLKKLHVFQSIKNKHGKNTFYDLTVVENGENRIYPLSDNLSPVVGYTGKINEDGYIRPNGKKGLEKAYQEHIKSKKDGYCRGKRDVSGRLIHDKNSIQEPRVDGLDLHLNISLDIQRRIELMLDSMKIKLDAQEILLGIMDSHDGRVLALASSNRFSPNNIKTKDLNALNPKFSEYLYEPGSVIKPLTLAIALNHNVVTPNSWFKTGYYKFPIGKKRFISDDDFFDIQTASDIIVHSSNIGISQISWKLTGEQFRDGLLAFGLSKPSGIDLSRDLKGNIKPLKLLENKMHRANSSYGYGMMVSFAQLFKAYSAFNNDGIAVTPRIVEYLEDIDKKQYIIEPSQPDLQAVSKKTANQIHQILLRVVNDKKGTGRKAQYPGLEIGGKTGTAHLVKHGQYIKEYHSSFYGFANDNYGHKYTIGVLVIKAKKWHKYFAAKSAVPTFRNAVQILVEQGYLKPDKVKETSNKIDLYQIEPQTNTDTPSGYIETEYTERQTNKTQETKTETTEIEPIKENQTQPIKQNNKVKKESKAKPKVKELFEKIDIHPNNTSTQNIKKPSKDITYQEAKEQTTYIPKLKPRVIKPKPKSKPKPKPKPEAIDLF